MYSAHAIPRSILVVIYNCKIVQEKNLAEMRNMISHERCHLKKWRLGDLHQEAIDAMTAK